MAWRTVAALAGFKAFIHIITVGAWGSEWFIDELYFMACAEHLDWGYVDMPPLFPFVLSVVTAIFGDSLFVVRTIAALAGAGLVVLTAALAREFGGDRWAQASAALCVILAPIYLVVHDFTTMNALDPLFWVGCALVLARILNGGDPKLWLLFGLLAGLGINSKHTFALWGVALVVGLLATPARSEFRSRWIWLGGAIAVLLFLPNLIWLVDNGFPHLEQLTNIRTSQRNVALSAAGFLGQQVLMLNAPAVVLWLGGLIWLSADQRVRRFRPLAIAWIVVVVLLIALDGRAYYPAPAHPVLLAAGGAALSAFVAAGGWRRWLRPAIIVLMTVSGLVIAPMWLLCLPADAYQRYTEWIGMDQVRIENHELGPLPQLFADRYGWREMAEEVARVYHALPEADRAKVAIYGGNYGRAGAIDHYRAELGLPAAISGHLTYFLWGPGDATGELMIVIGSDRERLTAVFDSVEPVGRIHHPYSMPYNHTEVFVCRGLKMSMDELWPQVKNYS
jgi:hypothetical protein